MNSGPALAQDTGTVLLGIEGVRVTGAEREADGRLTVWAEVTAPAACPQCGTPSGRVHEVVVTRPRDVRACGQVIGLFLVKRRLECPDRDCPRGTFTEWVPQVPPRCTVTRRLLDQAGDEIADRGITPAGAARHAGISWPSAHGAFAARADGVLENKPAPVARLGTDEHRRGRPRWRKDTDTGETVQLADRWQCAMRRLAVSPAEPGGTRREVLGSDG